ncbi:MAG: hypothetical protein ACI84C_002454, partial [Flavobacteriales bacterium]
SGRFTEDYQTANEDLPFEPHYDMINAEEDVQIYEIVMGNVDGEFTTVLDQAFEPLKDNRLVPNGFSFDHYSYDTTAVVGAAELDNNFAIESSINDVVRYAVDVDGYLGMIQVTANLWYQSLPPRWMEEIFNESTPEIDAFEDMYDNADKSPILIDSDDFELEASVDLEESHQILSAFNLVNNVSCDGCFSCEVHEAGIVRVFSIEGKLISTQQVLAGKLRFNVNATGYIVVDFEDTNGQHFSTKALIVN